jgi:hypothetical protein
MHGPRLRAPASARARPAVRNDVAAAERSLSRPRRHSRGTGGASDISRTAAERLGHRDSHATARARYRRR